MVAQFGVAFPLLAPAKLTATPVVVMYGRLRSDPGVAITFLIDQTDFAGIRQRLLVGDSEVTFVVDTADITAIDATVR